MNTRSCFIYLNYTLRGLVLEHTPLEGEPNSDPATPPETNYYLNVSSKRFITCNDWKYYFTKRSSHIPEAATKQAHSHLYVVSLFMSVNYRAFRGLYHLSGQTP